MKVLLLQEVEGLGESGQIKEVAEGYARNFLLPKKLAVQATPGTIRDLEARHAAEKKRQQAIDEEMKTLGKQMADGKITVRSKSGEGGKLYGSITTADIAEAVEKQLKQTVDKRKIEVEEPIRHVGEYKIPIKLSKNVTTTITLTVEGEEGE
jgi:large subunit ribosomal protein L9